MPHFSPFFPENLGTRFFKVTWNPKFMWKIRKFLRPKTLTATSSTASKCKKMHTLLRDIVRRKEGVFWHLGKMWPRNIPTPRLWNLNLEFVLFCTVINIPTYFFALILYITKVILKLIYGRKNCTITLKETCNSFKKRPLEF